MEIGGTKMEHQQTRLPIEDDIEVNNERFISKHILKIFFGKGIVEILKPEN